MGLAEEASAHIEAIRGMVATEADGIRRIVEEISACFERGGKVLVCGNGGSAADSQHFAAEFMNRMHQEREPWPTIALTTDTSVLTSIANDRSYSAIFARQVVALGQPGDVLVALSTSGTSETVQAAVRVARERGLRTVGFTGSSGAAHLADCDHLVVVPSRDTPRIQEAHEFAYHVIAKLVEETMVRERAQDGAAS